MLKNILISGLLLSAAFALYAGNKKTDQKVEKLPVKTECKDGCCTAKAAPTQAKPDNPLARSKALQMRKCTSFHQKTEM